MDFMAISYHRGPNLSAFKNNSAGRATIASYRACSTIAQVMLLASMSSLSAWSQTPPPAAAASDQDLAKQLANPVASLISVPIQTNYDFGVGAGNTGFRFTANVQPVIPIALSPKLNLITRNILPIVHQSDVFAPLDESDGGASGVYPGQGAQSGLGDLTSSLFFSPAKPVKGYILAAGPIILWPTATNKFLGTGKWAMGPTALVLKQTGPWTSGLLYNQVISIAGQSARHSVNSAFFQPFLTYTFKNTTSLAMNLESTYDFAGSNGWTVPVNFSAGKMFKIGKQLTNFTVGVKAYAAGPTGAPEWGMRFATTFLFPKKPKA
jgi:hypothetical protein